MLYSSAPAAPGHSSEAVTIISENGTYTLNGAPLGPATITVETIPPRKMTPAGKEFEVFGKYVPIPAKYADKAMSGITLEVKQGSQTFDIALQGM